MKACKYWQILIMTGMAMGGFAVTGLAAEEIVRVTRVIPGNDMIESVYMKGKDVVGKEVTDHGNTSYEGKKLQGTVTFRDEYRGTHGEEHFKDGLRHGVMVEYFPDGKVRSESFFSMGELRFKKEYDVRGKIRYEVNYEDALSTFDPHETGIGKVYYPNGRVKFEWSHTRSSAVGFKKSYNRDGVLTYAAYYDQDGRMIREEKP